jgi:nucleoid DNA-binding protein
MTINKFQLCARFREITGCTFADAKYAVETISEIIIDELTHDRRVMLGKLGTISLRHNKTRTGFNPAKNEKMVIPPRTSVKIDQTNYVKNLLIDTFNK